MTFMGLFEIVRDLLQAAENGEKNNNKNAFVTRTASGQSQKSTNKAGMFKNGKRFVNVFS